MQTKNAAQEGPEGPGQPLTWTFARMGQVAQSLARANMGSRFRQRGPGPRIVRLLMAVEREDGRTQRELVESLGIDRTTMGRLIDRLEHHGLVERKPHETDRRAYSIHITEAGRAASKESNAGMQAADAAFLEPLDGAEREQLQALLGKLQAGHSSTLEHLRAERRSGRHGAHGDGPSRRRGGRHRRRRSRGSDHGGPEGAPEE